MNFPSSSNFSSKSKKKAEIIMGDTGSSVSLVVDFNGLIKLYNDGSVVCEDEPNFHLPLLSESYEHVLYKDIMYNHTFGMWARVYLPPPPNSSPDTSTRLPVMVNFHGSSFCLFIPQSPDVHPLCVKWAADIGAVIVSVCYILAPKDCLPAAYHDYVSALQWIHFQSKTTDEGERANPWFDSHAEFSKVFLMGETMGGNIGRHL